MVAANGRHRETQAQEAMQRRTAEWRQLDAQRQHLLEQAQTSRTAAARLAAIEQRLAELVEAHREAARAALLEDRAIEAAHRPGHTGSRPFWQANLADLTRERDQLVAELQGQIDALVPAVREVLARSDEIQQAADRLGLPARHHIRGDLTRYITWRWGLALDGRGLPPDARRA